MQLTESFQRDLDLVCLQSQRKSIRGNDHFGYWVKSESFQNRLITLKVVSKHTCQVPTCSFSEVDRDSSHRRIFVKIQTHVMSYIPPPPLDWEKPVTI